MATELTCPRCRSPIPGMARYCACCGLPVEAIRRGLAAAGHVHDPQALPPPDGFEPVAGATDLYYRWRSSWGGAPLLGTETLTIELFNGGLPLRDLMLRISGRDGQGVGVFSTAREMEELGHGQRVALEIPSYDLTGPVRAVSVALARAAFNWDPAS